MMEHGGLPIQQELILKCMKYHYRSCIHVGLAGHSTIHRKQTYLTVHISDILTFVEPTTYTGRTYTLTDNEMDSATQALEDHK